MIAVHNLNFADTTNSTLTKFKFEKDLQSTTVTNNNQTKGLGNTTFGEFEDVLHRLAPAQTKL